MNSSRGVHSTGKRFDDDNTFVINVYRNSISSCSYKNLFVVEITYGVKTKRHFRLFMHWAIRYFHLLLISIKLLLLVEEKMASDNKPRLVMHVQTLRNKKC